MAAVRHLGFCYRSRCGLSMSIIVPNLVTISQPAAELLRFVDYSYLAILDHPRSLLMDLKRHRKVGVNRTSTFQDIAILNLWKFGLKRLFRPPKFMCLGVLISKVTERVVKSRLIDHLTQNRLLNSSQSAYRKLHSTETVLLSLILVT